MFGSEGSARADILKHLSPLINDESGEATTGTTISSAIISEMENLELVVVSENGNLLLSTELRPDKGERQDWQSFLQPIMRQRLSENTWTERCKQQDVASSLSWLLAQNSFAPIAKTGKHTELLRTQLSEGDPIITTIGNDARFQNMLYWARYLGFAEWLSLGNMDIIIPDPTRALVVYLPSIFSDRKDLSIGEFSARLAKICGLFEGGTVREDVEQRSIMEPRQKHHFSTSTSLALMRLAERGLIALQDESDAETWILNLGQKKIRTTLIEYKEKGKK
jgi:hypothetical protein